MKNSRFHSVFAVLMIVLSLAVIAAPWLIHAILGEKEAEDDNGLTEKRSLSEFPADCSNDWFSRFESFYSDHSPARVRIIGLESGVALNYNAFYRKNVNPVLTKILVRQTAPGPAEEGPAVPGDDTPTQAPATIDISLIIGQDTPEPSPVPTEEPATPTAEPETPTSIPETPTAVPETPTAAPKTPEASDPLTSSPGETNEPTPVPTREPTPEPTVPPTEAPTPHVHKWDSGRVRLGPSCVSEGEKVYTCTVCGETMTEKIPVIEHKYVVKKQSTADLDNYGYKLKKCSVCGKYVVDEIVPKSIDNTYLAPEYQGGAIFGRRDWLFYSGDDSEGYFRGTNLLGTDEMSSWKNKFEQLDNVCKSRGIELVILVAPNKEQMYPEYMPTYQIASQTKRQDAFLAYMKAESSVKYLYPKSELETTKIFYDVFYKQDTHWNQLGGFTGAMAVYRALGVQATNVFELDVTESTRKGGDLSNFSGYSTTYRDWKISYKNDIASSVEYYENHVTSSNTELSQFTTPGAMLKDKKIVVLGDSFRHAMSGIISKDFGKSTFAHRKELDYSTEVVISALRELSAGDVLLLTCVERYDGQLIHAADQLIAVLSE